jgi:hypothetical protein
MIFFEINIFISITHPCTSMIFFHWFTTARVVARLIIRARRDSVRLAALKTDYLDSFYYVFTFEMVITNDKRNIS